MSESNGTTKKAIRIIKKVDVEKNCATIQDELIERLNETIETIDVAFKDFQDSRRRIYNAADDLKEIRRKLLAA